MWQTPCSGEKDPGEKTGAEAPPVVCIAGRWIAGLAMNGTAVITFAAGCLLLGLAAAAVFDL